MLEVADLFRQFGMQYRNNHRLPIRMLKVMKAIESCRTSALGGHVDECEACGHVHISYNSCRNRHCPKCQGVAKEKWIKERNKDLLPVPYYHVVFTIPSELNDIVLRNQRELYNIFFRAVSETLTTLGKDPKYLGAEIGFIAILHTWGQNLMNHHHIHCIVPSGGLSVQTGEWITGNKKFFIPVKVLSRMFRGKFLYYLKKAYKNEELKFHGNIAAINKREIFQELIDALYSKEWVVYSKIPFGGPKQVIEYLGRYTHKVAISNERIINISDRGVTFKWRDYRDKNNKKKMTLDGSEFIRRFLLHVLPEGFMKIRHYGLLSNRNRNTRLKECKEWLQMQLSDVQIIEESQDELLVEGTGINIKMCSKCKKRQMQLKGTVWPTRHNIPDS
jgi:hypothetical protein